eukprot:1627294-Rhodomonas_salina.3
MLAKNASPAGPARSSTNVEALSMASVIVAWWDQQVELGLEVGRAFKTSQQSFVLPNNSTLTIDSTRKTLALHGAISGSAASAQQPGLRHLDLCQSQPRHHCMSRVVPASNMATGIMILRLNTTSVSASA